MPAYVLVTAPCTLKGSNRVSSFVGGTRIISFFMKNLSREEFEIYCLLLAAEEDFDITKQDLIAMGAKSDPETFVRVYNGFEADNESGRMTTITEHKTLYIKDELDRQNHFERMKKVFFFDGRFAEAEESVIKMLRNII